MLKRLSIKQRMYLIITLIFILFAVMIVFSVTSSLRVRNSGMESTEKIMLADQKDKIRVASHTIALAVGHAIENITNNDEKIKIIRNLIDDIRFEDDESGYYFVYKGTVNIAFPTNKDFLGRDLGHIKDKNGVYVIRGLHEKAVQGGGFLNYIWPKPGAGEAPKLSYAEMIPGTDYWIGTGVYLDNIDSYVGDMKDSINSDVKSMLSKIVLIAGLLFVVLVILCLVIVFGISRSLETMILSFQDVAEGEGDLTKRIKVDSKDELGVLAGWFNLFLEKLQKIIRNISRESQNVDVSSRSLLEISVKMSKGAQSVTDKSGNVSSAS